MGRCEKLLEKARRTPARMSFRELVYLAECFGFRLMRQRESHRIYERSGEDRPIVLTEQRGAAPEYQARQVLKALFPDESDQ